MDNSQDPAAIAEFGLSGAPPGTTGLRYFDENKQHPDATPEAKLYLDFEWDELDRVLNESQSLAEDDFARMASAMLALLQYLNDAPSLSKIGLRCRALMWVLKPDFSAAEVCRQHQTSPSHFSEQAAELSRKFAVRNRAGRSHGWNFKAAKPELN